MDILNILVRRHVPLESFEDTVSFYEALLAEPARLRLAPIPGELSIAQISAILIIGASAVRTEQIREAQAAFLVNDLAAYADELRSLGATVLSPPAPIETGAYMMVRHPDGMLVEYVEHKDKHPLDQLARAPGW